MQVLPTEIAHLAALNPAYDMPLFLVMFGGVLAGLIIGFIWEWIREAGERAAEIANFPPNDGRPPKFSSPRCARRSIERRSEN